MKNRSYLIVALSMMILSGSAACEVNLISEKYYDVTMTFDERTDLVTFGNTLFLDNKVKEDKNAYIGIDAYLDLKAQFKDDGPVLYMKAGRNGPFNLDAPIMIDRKLRTSADTMRQYAYSEYLPYIREYWADIPLGRLPVRVKTGLFFYSVGHGIAMTGNYENYGVRIQDKLKDLTWNLYYCYPDLANKRLGPVIDQEKAQGVGYQHSKANFFASDICYTVACSTFQPYVGVLIDHTGPRRWNFYSTPTVRDTLGTAGMSADIVLSKFSLGLEAAKNFGRAESDSPGSKAVEHTGYMLYSDAAYDLESIIPHARFIYASGNEISVDQVSNGDELFTGGKNRAFSCYSPLNANLADSLVPALNCIPLVSMGNGFGLNYGVNRPGTFGDPALLDNIVLFGTGFDCRLTEKFSFTVDWWHLSSAERGVGTFNGETRVLSPDLGNEVDLFIDFKLSEHVKLGFLGGYFLPGKFYKEFRDDTGGSLFTPFVRGDGEADPAYQVEFTCEICY